jgi:hypothetical protein
MLQVICFSYFQDRGAARDREAVVVSAPHPGCSNLIVAQDRNCAEHEYFMNVYMDNGKICWSDTGLSKGETLHKCR